ncbi:GolD/DthD family dehydrogenase [Burkholderia anthina]|uniref:D-threitol dehydrogenase n=1 Tax=Burkholderia anthina TaxID=179879 RepID=A0A6P2G9T0_9BURK|nr:D-threitol dehydrogenase [Burkholderia anthina]MBM2766286.1 D-threitol dehydrogenase [Burkholderia anthina]VVU50473.1 short chain dehydrogenase [Burkholderia anthina]
MPASTHVPYDYVDTIVVVTGAATGIGRAVAEAFAAAGATLALLDCSPSVTEVAAGLGAAHRGWIVDISDPDAVGAAADAIVGAYGRIDVLVNNAGIGPLAPAEHFPLETWDRTMAVNLRGAFLMARACAPGMLARGRGRIINMASQAAVIGIEGHLAYCASKAGLIGMTHCMALEWGARGVTVNAISPTVVETELGLSGWAGERGERARAAIPTRRFAQPAEIAAAVLYVASDVAAMMNGANLMIDGGYSIV